MQYNTYVDGLALPAVCCSEAPIAAAIALESAPTLTVMFGEDGLDISFANGKQTQTAKYAPEIIIIRRVRARMVALTPSFPGVCKGQRVKE